MSVAPHRLRRSGPLAFVLASAVLLAGGGPVATAATGVTGPTGPTGVVGAPGASGVGTDVGLTTTPGDGSGVTLGPGAGIDPNLAADSAGAYNAELAAQQAANEALRAQQVAAIIENQRLNAEAAAALAETQRLAAAALPSPAPSAGPGGLPAVVVKANGTVGDPSSARIVIATGTAAPRATTEKRTLTGQVLDGAGRPLAGASVDVFETLAIPGSPRRLVATVTTDRAGGFSYVTSARASQIVEFAYAAADGSGDYRDRVTTTQTVRAAVTFSVPKTAKPGRSVTLSGALDVDPLPARGARVMIETKGSRGWITAAIVRTRKGGAFRWSHAFRTKGSYRLRARVLPASDLPAVVERSPERTLIVR